MTFLLFATLLLASPVVAAPESQAATTQAMLAAIAKVPDAARLRAWHDMLASEPHVAGSEGDAHVVQALVKSFREMDLDVEQHDFWAYLPRPVAASVELSSPVRMMLPLVEKPLAEDPWLSKPGLDFGWNAYSGSGTVEARVVYVNQGTKEDFEKLHSLGVDVKGAIAIARYGGNFRGYKAKYAEGAGAAGLIIYSDPEDCGYVKGLMYPEGGWCNETTIQRGSILTLPWTGDPLTPNVEASRNAKRLDPSTLALPRIPVQPMGWKAAQEILSRMTGEPVPEEWQGGLPFTYRLTGGDALRVRLHVEQERRLVKTSNVLATLRGATHPKQLVLFGAHHDAWGYGAADPTCGTILVLEAARAFADATRRGMRPARSVVFCAWGAEEFGIIGSSEWVEARMKMLGEGAIAYFNADMATMGGDFGSSASPSLKSVIYSAVQGVPQARTPKAGDDAVVRWKAKGEDPLTAGLPKFGDLGGGSDHVGFLCHAGVASASLGTEGSKGNSYHSLYDDLHWYRQVVGDDYEPALMLTRIAGAVLTRLAADEVLPLDSSRVGIDVRGWLSGLDERARALGFEVDLTDVEQAARLHETRARAVLDALRAAGAKGVLDRERLDRANAALLALERVWILPEGLPGRDWYVNQLAAPDETSGYAPWMLPGLRRAIERKDAAELELTRRALLRSFRRAGDLLDELELVAAGLSSQSTAAPAAEGASGAESGARTRRASGKQRSST